MVGLDVVMAVLPAGGAKGPCSARRGQWPIARRRHWGPIEWSATSAKDDDAMRQLVPTGMLRVGIVAAPAASTLFVTKDASGEPHGVTVDLAMALGKKLGVPVDFVIAPNSGVINDATANAAIDVTFMPVDEERKKRVAFGPNYVLIEST